MIFKFGMLNHLKKTPHHSLEILRGKKGAFWYTCTLPSCFKLRKLEIFIREKGHVCRPHVLLTQKWAQCNWSCRWRQWWRWDPFRFLEAIEAIDVIINPPVRFHCKLYCLVDRDPYNRSFKIAISLGKGAIPYNILYMYITMIFWLERREPMMDPCIIYTYLRIYH